MHINFQEILLIAPPILLALTFHEFMHAWSAFKLGDTTARDAGRLNMNPLNHLDPIGTLMLFVVHFGYAKPVPVNPRNLRNPKRDMMLVSVAGPASNMLLALLSGLLLRIIRMGVFNFIPMNGLQAFYTMVYLSLNINIALAFFNLIPIPPLDGSKILYGLLPDGREEIAYKLEQYGPGVLMALIILGMVTGFSVFGLFLSPFIRFFSMLFGGI